MGMTGQQIYDNFHDGRGGDDLNAAADILNELTATYEDRRQGLRDLAVLMEQNWTGDAQDAAARGAAPLLVEHDLASADLGRGQDLGHRQVGSFDDAKHAVQPVPPRPEQPAVWDNIASGGAAGASYEQQVTAHNDAAQRNVDIMTGYTSASNYNATLPATVGTLAVDQGTIAAGDQTGTAGGVIQGQAHRGGTPTPRRADSSLGGSSGSTPPNAAPRPPAAGGPSDAATVPSATTPRATPPVTPARTPAGASPDRNPVVGGSAPVGGDVRRPGEPGALRPSPGGPVGSPGSSGGAGAGGGQQAGRGVGTGPVTVGPVVGGGPTADEAARRSSGAPLRPGASGTGLAPIGAAGGRSQGGDDQEHKCPSYLVQEDGESNFGVTELTAPPVIGDEDDD